jgi:hypothetical protein
LNFSETKNSIDLNHDLSHITTRDFKNNLKQTELFTQVFIEMLIVSRGLVSKRFLSHFSSPSSKCLFSLANQSRNQFHTTATSSLADNKSSNHTINNPPNETDHKENEPSPEDKKLNAQALFKSKLERFKNPNLLIELKQKKINTNQIERPAKPQQQRPYTESSSPTSLNNEHDHKVEKQRNQQKKSISVKQESEKQRESDLFELARLIDRLEPDKIAVKLMEPLRNIEQSKLNHRESSNLQGSKMNRLINKLASDQIPVKSMEQGRASRDSNNLKTNQPIDKQEPDSVYRKIVSDINSSNFFLLLRFQVNLVVYRKL